MQSSAISKVVSAITNPLRVTTAPYFFSWVNDDLKGQAFTDGHGRVYSLLRLAKSSTGTKTLMRNGQRITFKLSSLPEIPEEHEVRTANQSGFQSRLVNSSDLRVTRAPYGMAWVPGFEGTHCYDDGKNIYRIHLRTPIVGVHRKSDKYAITRRYKTKSGKVKSKIETVYVRDLPTVDQEKVDYSSIGGRLGIPLGRK